MKKEEGSKRKKGGKKIYNLIEFLFNAQEEIFQFRLFLPHKENLVIFPSLPQQTFTCLEKRRNQKKNLKYKLKPKQAHKKGDPSCSLPAKIEIAWQASFNPYLSFDIKISSSLNEFCCSNNKNQ